MTDQATPQLATIGKEPEIHVIPEQFYGVAGQAKLKAQKNVSASESKATATSMPEQSSAKPIGTAPSIVRPKRSSKKWILIPVLALIFLVGLGVGTWYLLKPPVIPSVIEEPPTTQIPSPAPEPEPTPAPAPEPEPTPAPAPEPEPSPLPGDDNDGDGLTSAEEQLYGTSDESADSDRDGFADLLEVVNLYNPSGFTPTRLVDAGLVKPYLSEESGYEMLYPSGWIFDVRGNTVAFSNSAVESIVVQVEMNQENQTLLDWFINEYPLVPTTKIEESVTKSGVAFITTPDGLTSYLFGEGVIYRMSLDAGHEVGATPLYLATYRMMVNSFTLTP